MRISYDFGDLEAFVAVMETGSFHLAAARTDLSQPAVSRRVRKLEEAFDTKLFERTTRQVRPTLAAKRLYERAQAMLGDAEEAALAMQDESLRFAHQRNALVTVAAIPTVLVHWLLPAIGRFRAAGHRARIRILDFANNEVAEAVAQGEADIGLCAMPAQEPGTAFQPRFGERLEAMVPVSHPLAARASLSWAELANADVVVPARGTGNRLLIDEAMASARRSLAWAYEAGRSTTALELARAGLAIALLPRSALREATETLVVPRPITAPQIERPMGILTRVGATPSPATRRLMDALEAHDPELGKPDGAAPRG